MTGYKPFSALRSEVTHYRGCPVYHETAGLGFWYRQAPAASREANHKSLAGSEQYTVVLRTVD
jgi:hypothetical protein